jgi:predicted ATPase
VTADPYPTSPLVTLFFGYDTALVRHAACDSFAATRHVFFPENDLHRSKHGALVDDWLRAAPARVVVATHSDIIPLRLQLRVVEGTLRPDEVIFFWIKADNEGSYLVTQPITLDETGCLSTWPGDEGNEDLEECANILDARERRFPGR